MNWRSIGHQLEINWRSIGHRLEIDWTSIGHQLEINWRLIGVAMTSGHSRSRRHVNVDDSALFSLNHDLVTLINI